MTKLVNFARHAGQYAALYFVQAVAALIVSGLTLWGLAALLNTKFYPSLSLWRFVFDFGFSLLAAYLGEYAQRADRNAAKRHLSVSALSVLFVSFGTIPAMAALAWDVSKVFSGENLSINASVLGTLFSAGLGSAAVASYATLVVFFLAIVIWVASAAATSIRLHGVRGRSVSLERLYLTAVFLLFVNSLLLQPVWNLNESEASSGSLAGLQVPTLSVPATATLFVGTLLMLLAIAALVSAANRLALMAQRALLSAKSVSNVAGWFLHALFIRNWRNLLLLAIIAVLLFTLNDFAQLAPYYPRLEGLARVRDQIELAAPPKVELLIFLRQFAIVTLMPIGIFVGVVLFRSAPSAGRAVLTLASHGLSLVHRVVNVIIKLPVFVGALWRFFASLLRAATSEKAKPLKLPRLQAIIEKFGSVCRFVWLAVPRLSLKSRSVCQIVAVVSLLVLQKSTAAVVWKLSHSTHRDEQVEQFHSEGSEAAILRLRLSLHQAAIICDPNDNGASLVWSFKEESRVAMPVAFCQLGPLPDGVVAVVFVGRSSREGDLQEENARALRRGWAMAKAAAPTLYDVTEDKIYVLNLGRSISLPRPGNDAGANANERQVQALIAVSRTHGYLNQDQVDLAVRDAVRGWLGSNANGTCELWKYDSQADKPSPQAQRSC